MRTAFHGEGDFISAQGFRSTDGEKDVVLSGAVRRRLGDQRFGATERIRDLHGGVTLSRAADEALRTVDTELERLGSLAERARAAAEENGEKAADGKILLRDAQRSLFQREYDEIVDRIERLAGGSSFDGIGLISGGLSEDADLEFSGSDGETFRLSIEEQDPSALGLTGLDVAGSSTVDKIASARDRVSAARGDVDEFAHGLVMSIRRELRSSASAPAVANRATAEELAEAARTDLVRDSGIAAQLHAPSFDAALKTLLGNDVQG